MTMTTVYERFDEAERQASEDEYIVACRWQGRELLIVTTRQPQCLPVPQLVVVRKPKRFAHEVSRGQ